jgi:hypothetical protein
MTPTQTRMKRPKGPAALPHLFSGYPCALVIRMRHMGHKVFDRLLFRRFPGASDREDKAPPAGWIGLVPVLDHAHVGPGAIGRIAAHDHRLCSTRGHKGAHHLAQQGIFAAIITVALGHNKSQAHWDALAVPRRHH